MYHLEGKPYTQLAWGIAAKSQLSVLEEPNRSNPFLDITDSDIDKANKMNMPLDDDDVDEMDDENL